LLQPRERAAASSLSVINLSDVADQQHSSVAAATDALQQLFRASNSEFKLRAQAKSEQREQRRRCRASSASSVVAVE
jgi:hypothetical protein